MTAPNYRYFVASLISGAIIDEIEFTDVSYSDAINSAGSFSGTVQATRYFSVSSLRKLTTPGNKALYVLRDDFPIWGGIVWDREFDQSTKKLTIKAFSFEIYFYHRVLWKNRLYDDDDVFSVVRDLVNAINVDFDDTENVIAGTPSPTYNGTGGRPSSADIGIALGTGSRGATTGRDFRGVELQYVGEAIDALSDNMNRHFEYRITPLLSNNVFNKRLDLYVPPETGDDTLLFFEFPGSISTYKWTDTMEGAATRFWVTGAGEGPTKRIERWTNNSLLDGIGRNNADDFTAFPLYDEIESSKHGSVKSTSRLQEYAQEYGKRAEPPLTDWQMTVYGGLEPNVSLYKSGDWAKFVIKDPSFGATESFTRRIEERTVSVSNDPSVQETVVLALTNESGPLTL